MPSSSSPESGLLPVDASLPAPVLQQVEAIGRLQGPLFEMCLRQTYANTGTELLEVVYTFPLPVDAVVLGFASELNGARQTGVVVARADAEARYEEALAEGDAPVMLERSAEGLLTANIGNLAPGDRVVIELRWGQWMRTERGQVRLALPTAIAPRYGDARIDGGLAPQQVPQHAFGAAYPFNVTIDVVGARSLEQLSCPTHAATLDATEDGVRARLAGAWLDRDVVFLLRPASASSGLSGTDPLAETPAVTALAALSVPDAPLRGQVALKILVDCSGSMNGDSITSARRALAEVIRQLRPADRVSYSRFGSDLQHDLPKLRPCDESIASSLRAHVLATEASLGGTEMAAALLGTMALKGASGIDLQDVLLITDGEIWDTEGVIAAARSSGHRVFAIGVGHAPAEGVLRKLAEATGGACEFATPGENLEQAVARSFARLRQAPWRAPRLQWGTAPEWSTELPPTLFGGDVLLLPARFHAAAPTEVTLVADDADGRPQQLARCAFGAAHDAQTLARMAVAQRLDKVGDAGEARRLALRYQLLTEHTHCLVVHERAEADKAEGAMRQHVVPQMMAAGWAGAGVVAKASAPSRAMAPAAIFCARSNVDFGGGAIRAVVDSVARPEILAEVQPAPIAPLSARDWLREVLARIPAGRAGTQAVTSPLDLLRHRLRRDIGAAVSRAAALVPDEEQAWRLLALWVAEQLADANAVVRLQASLSEEARRMKARVDAVFVARVASLGLENWA